ncbi:DUF4254 domain-containing protein [Nocardia aobensis]|uniref:DUF4254 domain-containing protein n=1 Tax=Nocardia aobensis TaxID=257277 RepID=A0ABW6NXT3_9NOCA
MNHPVLHAARKLAALHTARRIATDRSIHELDCSRADLVRAIDSWVAANLPQALGASYLHTESVGMVIDRIAQYSMDAHTALNSTVAEPNRHFHWQRLAELAVAYTDLAFEISAGLRRLPVLTYPVDNARSCP